MKTPCLFLLFSLLGASVHGQVLQYIIPVYGAGVAGANATWKSQILVSNPQSVSVTVRVSQQFPQLAEDCDCPGAAAVIVPARDTRSLDAVFLNGRRLRLGSVVLTADAPVYVESWIVRAPYDQSGISVQVVQISPEWLPAGPLIWVPNVFGGLAPETTNLFLVNPNTFPITVHLAGVPGDQDFDVPPSAFVTERLAYDAMTPGGFPQGLRIILSGSAPFYAVTSNGLLIRNPVTAR